MKTNRNLIFVAFAAMAFAACQEELADPNGGMQGAGAVVEFTGSVEDTQTKTAIHYQEGKTVFETLFTTADLISVNGVKSETVTPSADQQSITFGVADVTAPYFAVTGAHDEGYDEATNTYTILVSGTGAPQKYRTTGEEGQYASFWSNADILAAYGESQEFQFQHMSTFYAITVDAENSEVKDKIKTIYVRQGDGSNIAGYWNLSFGENNQPSLAPTKSLSTLIAFDCGEEGLSQGTTMIIGIPAYNYAEGLIFTIKDVNGKFASYKVPATKTQHATDGGLIIPFKPEFNPQSGTINTAEDWEAFAACMNSAKNDWDIYRWVGDGTVKLGADIEAENLTTITKDFPYVFDGGGFTITRTSATRSLFLEVSGEIKNLTLAGNLSLTEYGAPFARQLKPGGKMTDCTNEMNVTFEYSDETTYVAGFAAVLPTLNEEGEYVTTLTNCINKGDFEGATSYSQNNTEARNVAIGGIIGDVRSGGSGAVAYDVVLKNCKNSGSIKFTPRPSDDASTKGADLKFAMGITGIGGIAGTLRASKSIEFDDCDNTGDITLSAEGMTNKYGMKPYSISMGGVIGCGTGISGLGLTLTGHDITLKNCDNSGTLYNCGDNYSPTARGTNKVFTGGLAGALVGLSDKYASIQSCTNTGTILTYDLCSDDNPAPAVVSVRTAYNAVAGGLIGFGGYLDMENIIVDCQIGNGKRPVVSWGGVIGYAVRPFNFDGGTLNLSGYFQRISNYKFNRAVLAVVPDATADDGLTPDVQGSSIAGSLVVSGALMSSGSLLGDASATTSLVTTLATSLFNNQSKATSNLIGGGKSAQTTASSAGVDVTATITYK